MTLRYALFYFQSGLQCKTFPANVGRKSGEDNSAHDRYFRFDLVGSLSCWTSAGLVTQAECVPGELFTDYLRFLR